MNFSYGSLGTSGWASRRLSHEESAQLWCLCGALLMDRQKSQTKYPISPVLWALDRVSYEEAVLVLPVTKAGFILKTSPGGIAHYRDKRF
jgi:hypothetical protein